MKKIFIGVLILVILIFGYWFVTKNNKFISIKNDLTVETAMYSFCNLEWQEIKKSQVKSILVGVENPTILNADKDTEKEIVGLCRVSPYGKDRGSDPIYTLFILDDSANSYASIYKVTNQEQQRHIPFEDITVEDIDKDGIDEILYKQYSWYMNGGSSSYILYSPLYSKTFVITEGTTIDSKGVKTQKISFSDNTMPESFQIFLEEKLTNWKSRPHSED